jgi:hypothetical protein
MRLVENVDPLGGGKMDVTKIQFQALRDKRGHKTF